MPWEDRLEHLRQLIERDVDAGRYYGAVIDVSRGGLTAMRAAIGSADADGRRPLSEDSVFSVFSITKAFVNVLVLRAIEEGRFALTTRVSSVIPELSGEPRTRITFFHLLTHTSGLPGVWQVAPDLIVDCHDEVLAAVLERMHGLIEPGTRCDYSPMVNHVLLAEALRRTDPAGRGVRQILQEDVFAALAMVDSAMGVRPDLAERHVVPDMRGTLPITQPGRSKPGPYGIFEEEEVDMPWVGAVSTIADMRRFCEMLRHGGELDGVRLLSPTMMRQARRNRTGDMPNELYRTVALRAGWEVAPAYIGLGFSLRGERVVHHQFGTLTSPETFGNYGSGSSVYWVDPELDATFICLTAGLLPQAENIERFQQLSDVAVSALT